MCSNFAFKCHRDDKTVYPVNSISFHPTFGTFSTAGSDGFLHFWDKDSRNRLESSVSLGGPIQATCFNRNGSLFAYAVGYDWYKGHEFYDASAKNSIKVHPVDEAEVKPRNASNTFARRR
jgi:mRNA export factor